MVWHMARRGFDALFLEADAGHHHRHVVMVDHVSHEVDLVPGGGGIGCRFLSCHRSGGPALARHVEGLRERQPARTHCRSPGPCRSRAGQATGCDYRRLEAAAAGPLLRSPPMGALAALAR
jgi:hypothetical protein